MPQKQKFAFLDYYVFSLKKHYLPYLCVFFFFPFSLHAKDGKPVIVPDSWQIEGTLAVFSDVNPNVWKIAIRDKTVSQILTVNPELARKLAPKIASLLEKSPNNFNERVLITLGSLGSSAKDQAPKIVKYTWDPYWIISRQAANTFRDIGGDAKEYSAKFDQLLAISDSESLKKNVYMFGEMGVAAKAYVPQIAKFLEHPDIDVQRTAVEALGEMGAAAKSYAPQIVKLLQHFDEDLHRDVARTLKKMGNSGIEILPQVAKFLEHHDRNVKQSALWVMSSMGAAAKDHAPQIAKLLEHPDKDVQRTAVEALGEMGAAAKSYAPQIAKFLEQEDKGLQQRAVKALGKIGPSAKDQAPQIAKILQNLENYDGLTIENAIEALGEMGVAVKDQAPLIVKLFDAPYSLGREYAVSALVKLGGIVAVLPQIAKFLDHRDRNVRETAIDALTMMSAAEKGQVTKIAEFLDASDKNLQQAAVWALGGTGSAANPYVPQIAKLLENPENGLRLAAVNTLGKLGATAKAYASQIAELLDDSDVSVHQDAISALGSMGAVAGNYAPQIAKFLDHKDWKFRRTAIFALEKMGAAAKDQAPLLAKFLEKSNFKFKSYAIDALGEMGAAAKEQAPKVAEMLRDLNNNDVRRDASRALGRMGPLDMKQILYLLGLEKDYRSFSHQYRFFSHFLGGGDKKNEILIAWLGRPSEYPSLDRSIGIEVLNVFIEAWELDFPHQSLRDDMAKQIAYIAKNVTWQSKDHALLKKHAKNLELIESTHAPAVRKVLSNMRLQDNLLIVGKYGFYHILFWVGLLLAYPRFRQVQAIFFWNPWVRRIIGLGYVEFALTWTPLLRNTLLAPFRDSLLADAGLEHFHSDSYFNESDVISKGSNNLQSIQRAIPEITGQIVLEGESGLGKTMFLRDLIIRSKRIVVYLPAEKCSQGVIEGVQTKLHGLAQDEKFLRNLIYSGALDICIDGLNEVTAETRARITQFAESFFKGNILLATQPLEWRAPSTSRVLVLQPLTRLQIERFLISRRDTFVETSNLTRRDFEGICRSFLAKTLDDRLKTEVLVAIARILSNPMDLSVIAQMLANRLEPDIFHLQEQQYNMMAVDYKNIQLQKEFPLAAFSETVYQMRINDVVSIPQEKFIEEIPCMVRHKMVVIRQFENAEGNPKKEFHFRHDKVMEFFIVMSFLGQDNDRAQKHIADPRFRGVYFLLATMMTLEDAKALREELIQYAADTKDHMVSDRFIQLIRSRKTT